MCVCISSQHTDTIIFTSPCAFLHTSSAGERPSVSENEWTNVSEKTGVNTCCMASMHDSMLPISIVRCTRSHSLTLSHSLSQPALLSLALDLSHSLARARSLALSVFRVLFRSRWISVAIQIRKIITININLNFQRKFIALIISDLIITLCNDDFNCIILS